MKSLRIAELLQSPATDAEVVVKGWVRTKRGNKNVAFIALNDGSCVANMQVVVDLAKFDEELLRKVTTGACLRVDGRLVASCGAGQGVEVQAEKIEIYGTADPETYPLQKKGHSLEFLRDIAYLRPRTNTFGAIFRIRHAMAYAIHKYFNDKGFYYLHTPLITASDCEGAGAMFQVTTLDLNNLPKTEEGAVDYSQDFFGRPCSLTVSGQLEGELGALSLGQIYTFGPTFRAENSNTPRHLSEFWMIEPEMAFYELEDNMELAEDFLKYLIRYALENCREDLEFMNKMWDNGLIERLNFVLNRIQAAGLHRGRGDSQGFGPQVRIPLRLGVRLAVGTRTLSGRGALQASGDPYQLSEADQGFLHEAERGWKDRPCDGRAVPEDRRDYRRFGARGRLRKTFGPCTRTGYERERTLVVSRHPSLGIGSSFRFRTRVRAPAALRDGYG